MCNEQLLHTSKMLLFIKDRSDLAPQSTINVAVKMAVDLGIFKFVNGPTTIDQLQQKTGADGVLLRASDRF